MNATLNNYFMSSTGRYFVAKTPEVFTNDADGNLLSDGRFTYDWNAENRLTQVTTPGNLPSLLPRVKVKSSYDHQGRRIVQTIQDYNGTDWPLRETRRFIYDGWNLIGETRTVTNGTASTNWYVWGLDLSGSIQGAGGVGGLMFAQFPGNSKNYYAFDGNGNVSELVGVNGQVRAHYEYDPFGNSTTESGTLALTNPFRFSTKYWDADTKLSYYGYRYYSPGMGRWASRDPIGELGEMNVYSMIENSTVNDVDVIGEKKFKPRPDPGTNKRQIPVPAPKPRMPIPELPVGTADTKASAYCGALDLGLKLLLLSTREEVVVKGYQRCVSLGGAPASPSCKCCVIDLRHWGCESYTQWELVTSYVADSPCAKIEESVRNSKVWRPQGGPRTGYEYEFRNW